MNPFTWLMSGGKMAEKAADAVINTGDALFFTEEEKSVASAKKLDWALKYLQTTSGQNLARRVVAFGVVGLWVTLILIACVSGYWNHEKGSYSVWLFKILEDVVNQPFMIIVGFYFMTGLIRAGRTGG
jgi:hypothetical protein